MNVSQSKNGIMINANVDVKNYLIGLHVKMSNVHMWDPSTCHCEYDKKCDICEYLVIKNF